MVTVFSISQYSNVARPIVSNCAGSAISCNSLHDANAYCSMVFSCEPSANVQYISGVDWKARCFIMLTVDGMLMRRIVVPRKAYSPIEVIPSGRMTLLSSDLPSNALSGTVVIIASLRSSAFRFCMFLMSVQSLSFILPFTFRNSTSSSTSMPGLYSTSEPNVPGVASSTLIQLLETSKFLIRA